MPDGEEAYLRLPLDFALSGLPLSIALMNIFHYFTLLLRWPLQTSLFWKTLEVSSIFRAKCKITVTEITLLPYQLSCPVGMSVVKTMRKEKYSAKMLNKSRKVIPECKKWYKVDSGYMNNYYTIVKHAKKCEKCHIPPSNFFVFETTVFSNLP